MGESRAPGGQLRRRIPIVAAVALAGAIGVAIAVHSSSGGHQARLSAVATTTNPPTTTSVAPAKATTTTTSTSSAADQRAATSTTIPCRNSFDVRCGPMRWGVPLPPNRPGTITATQLARRSGDDPGLVRLSVTYSDPDSGPYRCGGAFDPKASSQVDTLSPEGCTISDQATSGPAPGDRTCPGFFGTWDSIPPPNGSSGTYQWNVHDETPGPHTVTFYVMLGRNPPVNTAPLPSSVCDPYSEVLVGHLDIVVPSR